jgi:hypothetical protein
VRRDSPQVAEAGWLPPLDGLRLATVQALNAYRHVRGRYVELHAQTNFFVSPSGHAPPSRSVNDVGLSLSSPRRLRHAYNCNLRGQVLERRRNIRCR